LSTMLLPNSTFSGFMSLHGSITKRVVPPDMDHLRKHHMHISCDSLNAETFWDRAGSPGPTRPHVQVYCIMAWVHGMCWALDATFF
jgi:hypothetical protein